MPHRHRIYAKASDMEKTAKFAYPQSDDAFLHWICVLLCCAECSCINLLDQEIDNQYSDTKTSISFCIYYIIVSCTDHGILPLKDRKICHMCKQDSLSDESTKVYTRE